MSFITNMRIGGRLLASFGILQVLLVVMILFSANLMQVIDTNIDNIATVRVVSTRHAGEMAFGVERGGSAARDFVLLYGIDRALAETQAQHIAAGKQMFDSALHEIQSTATASDTEHVTRLARTADEGNAVFADLDKAVALTRANRTADALGVIKAALPIQLSLTQDIQREFDHQALRAGEKYASAEAAYDSALRAVYILGALMIVVGVGLALALTRSITRPLSMAVKAANAIAEGDLSNTIAATSKDETGQLLGAMKTMQSNLLERASADKAITEDMDRVVSACLAGDLTARIDGSGREGATRTLTDGINKLTELLREIVTQMKETSSTVSVAVQQIAAGNADLANRTEEQASSLEETAASMEELTSTVKQNDENARQAHQLSIGASDIASKGGDVVRQVVETMASINDSARKIVDIISVIDGIAFQTNILALNAAVEAARAGEQGRGFAVVAGEVRNLAQRSAGAAKEIKALISNSVEKTDAGSRQVDSAGATMNEIVAAVKRVTDIMSEIAAASKEQLSGIEQVNVAIMQMDQATQQNAGLVEEAAASSASLEEQALKLVDGIAIFNVGTSANAPSPAKHAETKRVMHTKKRVQRQLVSVSGNGHNGHSSVESDDADWETF
ncbi:MAG TPA: methyl-accepting chemotaxis protein [Candidatus Acidoferrales bacterium]|jgi:methyl-accepting chemotaxis protein|nr:methyl-accepting chemotaxis protein [Candidatus Acidoferrales bacterium]